MTLATPLDDFDDLSPKDRPDRLVAGPDEPTDASLDDVGSRRRVISGVAIAAAVAVMVNDPLTYVADARFDLAWAPGKVLTQVGGLWQQTGGLGRTAAAEQSPVVALVYTVLRAVGASPGLAEHLWHALLLATCGLGVAMLVATVVPRWGVAHFVAAVAYMFHPLTLGLFSNSVIFGATAVIAPWLHVAVLRMARQPQSWRWPALFALAVSIPLPAELPGVMINVALVLPTIVYVLIERSVTGRTMVRVAGRTALLVGGATAFVVARTIAGRRELLVRLALTEPPELVNIASSFSETIRGMGNWLVYFRFGSSQPRPQFAPYLTSTIAIAATFLVPVVAIGSLRRSNLRARLLFVLLTVISLMVAVGVYATPQSWWGAIVSWVNDAVPSAQAFRNTLKAGGNVALPLCVLFGLAVAGGTRRRHDVRRWVVPASALAGVAIAAIPVWSLELYSEARQIDDVPAYWMDSFRWLNDAGAGGDGRVLVLPGSSSTLYRWGNVGDDILNAFLSVPYVRAGSFPQSTPMAESAIAALDARTGSAEVAPEALADVLRRLGVRWVLLRNDTDWQTARRPRPATFDPIRSSDVFTLAATFGSPGQNTTDGADTSEEVQAERLLAPVEVYELRNWQPIVRLAPSVPPLLVSGDGSGWIDLAERGFVAGSRPLAFTASMDEDQLAASLRAGSTLLVTDTNVLRNTTATATTTYSTSALQSGATGPGVGSLFSAPGTQTVSSIDNVERVTSSVSSVGQPWARAENVFDRDGRTVWRSGSLGQTVGQWIQIDFSRPYAARSVSVELPADDGGPRIEVVSVLVPGSPPRSLVLLGGRGSVDLDGRPAASIRIRIDRVNAPGAISIADVRIDNLDLAEYRQVPSDVVDRAAADPTLAAVLQDADVGLSFHREIGAGDQPVESVMRRRFELQADYRFEVRGRVEFATSAISDSPELGRCGVLSIAIDGRQQPAEVTSIDADGLHGDIRLCDALSLGRGWHTLSHSPDFALDWVTMLPPSVDTAALDVPYPVERPTVSAARMAGADVVVPAGTSDGYYLVSGRAAHEGWQAEVDGRALVKHEFDAQSVFETDGAVDVSITFAPQTTYDVLFVLMVVTFAVCIFFVVRRDVPRSKGST